MKYKNIMSYSDKSDAISKEEWLKILESKEIGRTSMNKLIMDYLVIGRWKTCSLSSFLTWSLSEGFKEAAEKFQQESGIGPTVELDSLDNRIRIRDAIMTGRIQEATAHINQLHPELLDNDRYLYFHLQVNNTT